MGERPTTRRFAFDKAQRRVSSPTPPEMAIAPAIEERQALEDRCLIAWLSSRVLVVRRGLAGESEWGRERRRQHACDHGWNRKSVRSA